MDLDPQRLTILQEYRAKSLAQSVARICGQAELQNIACGVFANAVSVPIQITRLVENSAGQIQVVTIVCHSGL